MKRNIITTLSAAMLIAVRICMNAAPGHYVLTNADGLSNSIITCVTQDSIGRLWVGTRDGLNVYDAHQFWIWRHEPDNGNSISGNIIWSIAEQGDGVVWVTCDNGINRIDTRTSTVWRFHLGYEHSSPPGENTFSTAISPDGRVFCSAAGGIQYRVLPGGQLHLHHRSQQITGAVQASSPQGH